MITIKHKNTFIDVYFNVEVVNLQEDKYIVHISIWNMSENMYELTDTRDGRHFFKNISFHVSNECDSHKEIAECIGGFCWSVEDFVIDYS